MTQANAEPAPETAGLEHSDPATNARLRKAAFHATRLYPGPVGELIADELLAVEAWGYRVGGHATVTDPVMVMEAPHEASPQMPVATACAVDPRGALVVMVAWLIWPHPPHTPLT
uniref:hypothetical protein n=1 Tax=Salmonella enterica TaxID=28901 RepID=UPI003297BB4B